MPVKINPYDLIGVRKNMLMCTNVVEDKNFGRGEILEVICDCGTIKTMPKLSFTTTGCPISCGCVQRAWIKKWNASEEHSANLKTHNKSKTGVYRSWVNMKSRCNDPRQPCYPNYGGRGISYCSSWEKFENFLGDMGERPEGSTLERKDVNRDYSPENCVWDGKSQQAYNQRKLDSCSSPYVGVSYNKSEGLYKAGARVMGKIYHLGYSDSDKLLALRYDALIRFLRGKEKGRNEMLGILSTRLEDEQPFDEFLFKVEGFRDWFLGKVGQKTDSKTLMGVK